MSQQRDTIREISPPWLTTGVAEKLMYDFGLSADALLEKLNQAMRAHMPGAGTDTALVFLGNDRVIPQGPYEANDDYAGRLTRAYESWQRAGSRRAVLSQVAQYLDSAALPAGTQNPLVAIVGGTTPDWDIYYADMDVAQPPAHVVPTVVSWSWDGDTSKWWRAWLVLYFTPVSVGSGAAASITSAAGFASVTGLSGLTGADVGRVLVFSGAATGAYNSGFRIEAVTGAGSCTVSCALSTGADANNGAISWTKYDFPTVKPGPAWDAPGAVWDDPTRSWGLANPPGVMSGVKEILAQWQSEHSYYLETLIVFSDGTGVLGQDISPFSATGAGNPDGTWAAYSKIVGGVSVPARVFTGAAPGSSFAKFNEFGGPSL